MLQRLYLTLHASCAEHAIRSKRASYYDAMCMCVLILLCVSSYYYVCPHTTMYVLILPHRFDEATLMHMCARILLHVSSYSSPCVLILLHMSSYY